MTRVEVSLPLSVLVSLLRAGQLHIDQLLPANPDAESLARDAARLALMPSNDSEAERRAD